MNIKKSFTVLVILISLMLGMFTLAGCSGGSSSSSGSGQQGGMITSVATVTMGNISLIPIGNGSSGQSSITVTNNLKDLVNLKTATYTLTESGVTSSPINATLSGSLVNVSQCGSLSAHGTCSIGISVPAGSTQGQYVITLEFINLNTNKTYIATNIVPYSNQVSTSIDGGFRYFVQNSNIYNQVGGSTTMTIPFQLMKTFTNLKATVANLNPAFSPSISCPGNSYAIGTLCNLFIKVSSTGTNPIIIGNVTVSGDALNNNLNIKSNKHLKVQNSLDQFAIPLTVIQNNSGNLLTSALNVVQNNNVPQTITLLNNGVGTITNIKISQGNSIPISIPDDSNNCSSLSSGSSCTFKVSSNSQISGQNYIAVTYNNGNSNGSNSSLTFNFIYIASEPTPSLSLISGQGNINNIPNNSVVYYSILVNNNGSSEMRNITFTDPKSQSPYFSWDSSSSCNLSGLQSLSPNQQCTLVLKYSPTQAGSGNLSISATGTYTNQGGNPVSYNAALLGISYSSITGDAFLYIAPNETMFNIRADGSDSESKTFRVVNAGLQVTKVSSINIPVVSGFVDLGTGTCRVNQNLNVNESCIINTRFGPVSVANSNIESYLSIGYKPNANYISDVYAFSKISFNSSLAALVNVTNILVNGANSGSGTSESPYIFTNSPAVPVLLTKVTYTNNGTATANNFNVSLNNLPIGYAESVSGTTCATGVSMLDLNPGSSCDVSFYAVNPNGLYNPYTINGTGLGFNIPGFSYIDTNTGTNTNQFPIWSGHYANSNNIFVTTNLFATVNTLSPSWSITKAGTAQNFVFNSPTNGTVITIPAGQLGSFITVGGGRTCTISSGSCSIPITYQNTAPLGAYYFDYYVTPAGISPAAKTNSTIQNANFTLTN
ncbi:MAG: hypothetical protein ACK5Z5_02035 [Neisseriaceae bacterium]